MGFLPVLYLGGFLFLGLCSYVCLSVVGGQDKLGKNVFWALIFFGISSYIGFIAVMLVISFSPLKVLFDGRFPHVVLVLAWLVPGLLGTWLSIWALSTLRLWQSAQSRRVDDR
jgi:hypothetical protein